MVYSDNPGKKYADFLNIFVVVFKPQATKNVHNYCKQTVKIYL